jgi:hypothetical protein
MANQYLLIKIMSIYYGSDNNSDHLLLLINWSNKKLVTSLELAVTKTLILLILL